jgi:hypothetical protein
VIKIRVRLVTSTPPTTTPTPPLLLMLMLGLLSHPGPQPQMMLMQPPSEQALRARVAQTLLQSRQQLRPVAAVVPLQLHQAALLLAAAALLLLLLLLVVGLTQLLQHVAACHLRALTSVASPWGWLAGICCCAAWHAQTVCVALCWLVAALMQQTVVRQQHTMFIMVAYDALMTTPLSAVAA